MIKIFEDFSNSTIEKNIKNTIDCKEKYAKVYFWTPSSNKKTREWKEEKFHREYPNYNFEYLGNKYEVEHNYEEKSSRIEFSIHITKNGLKTNLTTLKNIYIRLSKEKKYNI